MSTSKKIVFFGTDSFSVSALQHLITADFPVALVVTKPDSKSGRGQKLTAPLVKQIAQQHSIPVLQPTKVTDIESDLLALGEDRIGVLSSFGRIIPQSIIDMFSPGILNIHPSLLPVYRGPSPIETALIRGDQQTGVSLMLLSAKMDAGPVYDQIVYPLSGNETQSSLYTQLADLGSNLLLQHLPAILENDLQPSEQKGEPTYSHLLQKSDAIVDPKNDTAKHIERHVRAYEVFPKTKTEVLGQMITITTAHVGKTKTGELSLTCSDTDLIIDTLIAPNGRRMTGKDFLRGYNR